MNGASTLDDINTNNDNDNDNDNDNSSSLRMNSDPDLATLDSSYQSWVELWQEANKHELGTLRTILEDNPDCLIVATCEIFQRLPFEMSV